VLAERRIAPVVEGLNDLAARGISSCSVEAVAQMNQTAFETPPIKEVALVARDGQTICTNLGILLQRRQVVSGSATGSASDIVIEVVRLGRPGQRMLRIRRTNPEAMSSLSALIGADLLPKVSPNGGPFRTYARLTTADGTLVDEGGASFDEDSSDRPIVSELRSEKYGLIATASLSRANLLARYADFRLLGTLGTVGVLFLAFSIAAYRRQAGNPVAEIEAALESNQFVPYYQPILDITTGRLAGAEVLIRWRKPDGTMVMPGSFIPLAESCGLIFAITRALMRQTCREVGQAIGSRSQLKIGFNLTARHFADEATATEVRDIFASSPIALSQVVLEVTEREPLEDLDTARRVIASLQALGVRVAIDDIGTGHGGLSYLLKLGVDILKIDKLFVDAIGSERYSTTIISSLVELGRNMRMDIIAEGVETFEQVAYLRDQGIQFAQGYVFAPPLPGSLFLQLLEAADPLPAFAVEPVASPKSNVVPLARFGVRNRRAG
jgi:sensor c-di-GMP phosphodiesterase-like protein